MFTVVANVCGRMPVDMVSAQLTLFCNKIGGAGAVELVKMFVVNCTLTMVRSCAASETADIRRTMRGCCVFDMMRGFVLHPSRRPCNMLAACRTDRYA